MKQYEVGTKVTWSSGGGHGKFTSKVGNVIAVAKKGEDLRKILKNIGISIYDYHIMFESALPIRDDIRYVVEVPGEGKGKSKLYCPRTSSLELVS